MVTIVADQSGASIGQRVHEKMTDCGYHTEFFDLEGMRIEPCYGCGGCTYQTFGKCIVRDDADKVIPTMLRSKIYLFVSPVQFGGMSFSMKRMVDKFALVGDRYYYMNKGQIVKGRKRDGKHLHVVGYSDEPTGESVQSFLGLVKETQELAVMPGLARVLPSQSGPDSIEKIVEEMVRYGGISGD